MIRINTFSSLQEITSTFLNALQDAVQPVHIKPGTMVGCPYVESTNGTTVTISQVEQVYLYDGTSSQWYGNSGTASITVSALEGGGAFAAHTWYYVYAKVTSSALAFVISTTVPDNARVLKNGTTTHRYLAAFRTDSTGAIIPFRKVAGTVLYGTNTANASTLTLSESGAHTSSAAFALTPSGSTTSLIPPHARHVLIEMSCANSSTSAQATISVYSDTTDANSYLVMYIPLQIGTTPGKAVQQVWAMTNSSQQLSTITIGIGATGAAWRVLGFRE